VYTQAVGSLLGQGAQARFIDRAHLSVFEHNAGVYQDGVNISTGFRIDEGIQGMVYRRGQDFGCPL
jgi:hypothetical protein